MNKEIRNKAPTQRELDSSKHKAFQDVMWQSADFSNLRADEVFFINCEFVDCTFENAAFKGTLFERGRITNSQCAGWDLNGSFFQSCHIFGSDFREVNFGETRVAQTSIDISDLSEGSFLNSEFIHNHLDRCKVEGTQFRGMSVANTVFEDIDFSRAEGVNEIIFSSRCILDPHTLAKSRDLPLPFLRGCGFSDTFIDYIPTLFSNGMEFYSCFISYSSLDKAFAKRLHDALQGRGVRCWLDEHQILPGDKIHHEIDQGIKLWDKVLLCCSENSLGEGTSWWVENEIESAFKKERSLRKQKGEDVLALIPLDLDGYLFSDDCENAYQSQIQSRNAGRFQGWESSNDLFEEELDKVVRALRADAGRKPPPPKPKL